METGQLTTNNYTEAAAPRQRILTTQEVAEYLGLSPQEVRRLAEEGFLKKLHGFRHPWKFSLYAVENYLQGIIPEKKKKRKY